MLAAPLFAFAQGVITTIAGHDNPFPRTPVSALSAPLPFVYGVAVDSSGNIYASISMINLLNNHIVKLAGGNVSVVAGNGLTIPSGEGGTATSASFGLPYAVVADNSGNLYLADYLYSRIRKVSAGGIITTIAGTGTSGFSGDGGLATNASITLVSLPCLALDSSGNLYFAGGNRVRKVVLSTGIITTVAGTGIGGFSGDGGAATSAQLNFPTAVTVDAAGNLYISDSSNQRVRQVNTSGIISTVAGKGVGGFSGDGGPATAATFGSLQGLAADSAGNIYVSDPSTYRIRKFAPGGNIVTVAGNGTQGFSGDNGPATSASLFLAAGIAVDSTGNLYIADNRNFRIRKVDTAGTITTIAGSGNCCWTGDGGSATLATLANAVGLVLSPGANLYVFDSTGARIRKITPGGTISAVAGTGTPGFSGDGGPASSAMINVTVPTSAGFDSAGNFYFADTGNFRVRKIDTSGTITTIAGTGGQSFSGDGGPATSATLVFPRGVAVDAAGNVYIIDNTRVRKVAVGGTITTIAGTASSNYSGDGGLATAADLNTPLSIAIDASGNIFLEEFSSRIRKFTEGGIITTIAGTATNGFSGDGGPATSATFASSPFNLAADPSGNLFVADTGNLRVRKIDLSGIVTTVAGTGAAVSKGDGGPPLNASFWSVYAVAADALGFYVAEPDRIRRVTYASAPPSANVTPSSLSFSAPSGAGFVQGKQIVVNGSAAGLPYDVDTMTSDGGGWLLAGPDSGTTPGTIAVTVKASGMAPGNYDGQVIITSLIAQPSPQVVAVHLTITAAASPLLSVQPVALNFESTAGSTATVTQEITLANAGGGSLNWTASALGGAWLSVAPVAGTSSDASPSVVPVSVNPTGLAAGTYQGSITILSSTTSQTLTIPVVLIVRPGTPVLKLSQAGLYFSAASNSGLQPAQAFNVVNLGSGTLNWTAAATTVSGGSWLSISPTSGSGNTQVSVQVDPTGLATATYNGFVRVDSAGAADSPQFVLVKFDVQSAGVPEITVQPANMSFNAAAGGASPGSQTLLLSVPAAGTISVNYTASFVTRDGSAWLRIFPATGTITAASPGSVAVQPVVGSLAAGIYQATITLTFNTGAPAKTVGVIFVVSPAACTATKLVVQDKALRGTTITSAGRPTPLQVSITDDCGVTVTNATVTAVFSNGDPPITLANVGGGTYSGTWRPASAASLVLLEIRAATPSLLLGIDYEPIQVLPDTAPVVATGGVVHTPTLAGGALAPGSLVTVFGQNLATALATASSVPLSVTLAGSSLNIGGVSTPLFSVATGRIDAQIPFGLPTNSRLQAYVQTPTGVSVPETITLIPAAPALFSDVRNSDLTVNSPTNPALTGQTIIVYAGGLGPTSPAVAAGAATPATPTSNVTTPVTATVGGVAATVQFAGLVPGVVGRYQVNLTLPGVAGVGVPVVLTQNGVASNAVPVTVQATGNPVPSIFRLATTQNVMGVPGFNLIVQGNNSSFTPASVGRWNGSDRPTTFSDSSTLFVHLTALDMGTPGPGSVTVFNPAPGGGLSNAVTFTVLAIGGVFSSTATFAAPGGIARIPILMTLSPGVSIDTLSFGVWVIPVGPAPALPLGTMTYQKAAGLPDPSIVDTGNAPGQIAVAWINLPVASGTVRVGEIDLPIPANATVGQTYTTRITGAQANKQTTIVPLTLGVDTTITITSSYLVGDSSPATGTGIGTFGNSSIDNFDLIDVLRAVTNLPGFLPPACSDRFDAMDSFPVDTVSARGGDGSLNNLDILASLARVTNVDTSRPQRPPRGLACSSAEPVESRVREGGPDSRAPKEPEGQILFGSPRRSSEGVVIVPAFLRAGAALGLSGLSFSLGITGSSLPLNFEAGELGAPTLVDRAVPGMMAMAWLEGLEIEPGRQVLLGYVEVPSSDLSVAASLRVFGVSANGRVRDGGRRVILSSPQ